MTIEQMINLYGVEKVEHAARIGIRYTGGIQLRHERINSGEKYNSYVSVVESEDAFHRFTSTRKI